MPSAAERQLHLNLRLRPPGDDSVWRLPSVKLDAYLDADSFVEAAQIAEQGLFDLVFIPDLPALPPNPEVVLFDTFDPQIIAAAMLRDTTDIGVVITGSTSFEHPYPLARKISSLDHLSGGRIGWNIVTSNRPVAGDNYGVQWLGTSEERYERAREFTDVAIKLWTSWEPDAVLLDRESGVFADPTKIKPINHEGKYFRSAGPLQLPRSPQGVPLLFQAGDSGPGRDFAAQYADAVFTPYSRIEDVVAYSDDIKRRAASFTRPFGGVPRVFPALKFVLGGTEAEAQQRKLDIDALTPRSLRIHRFADRLGLDAAALTWDEPVPADQLAKAELRAGTASTELKLLEPVNGKHRSVGEIISTDHRVHRDLAGTPEQIADFILEWFGTGAVDGFNLTGRTIGDDVRGFVDEVVPLLQKAGVYRTEYSGRLLTERLGASRI